MAQAANDDPVKVIGILHRVVPPVQAGSTVKPQTGFVEAYGDLHPYPYLHLYLFRGGGSRAGADKDKDEDKD